MNVSSSAFVSRSINSLDIKIDSHGFVKADNEWKSNGMSIPYSKLYFIFDGKGYISASSKTYELLPQNIYLVPYGVHHSFHCDDSMEKLFFHFTVTKSDGKDMLEGKSDIYKLESDIRYSDKLKKLYFDSSLDGCFKLKHELYDTVINFITDFELCDKADTEYSSTVAQVISFIRKNLSVRLTVKAISDELYISQSTITKKFYKETGLPIGKYIDEALMTEARRALMRSEEPIHDISERLGFCDQFYFSRKFRQYYNSTPTQYRKKHSNL